MPHPRPDTSVVKRCSGCKETLPRENFGPNKKTFDELCAYCRPCSNKRYKKWRASNLELARELSRTGNLKARQEDPRRFKTYELKARYGITLEEYETILKAQGNTCAICQNTEPGGMGMFHVDHCHKSAEVRGLLCNRCNAGLGQFLDDPELLKSAIRYLTKGG